MDFTSGSGGLMLVALAAVWFIVFLPSLGKKNRDKNEEARDRRLRREELTAASSPALSQKIRKAKLAKRVFTSLTAAAIVGTIIAVFQGSTMAAGVGVAAVAASAILVRVSANTASRALGRTSQRRSKIANGVFEKITEQTGEQVYVEDKTWRPSEIPGQVYRGRLGTLESPDLAEVVELGVAQEFASDTLDEILRRRRAN